MCTDFHHLFENNRRNVQGVLPNSIIVVYSLICGDRKNVSNNKLTDAMALKSSPKVTFKFDRVRWNALYMQMKFFHVLN